MNNHTKYIRYTWFVLVMVFLVILAGSVVRMTQSGMGCPDWPKCFGRWIPPTSASELPADYEKYLKAQDIDHTFNVYHTWIEYINRLFGALLGVFIFIHFVWSFLRFRKTNKAIVLFSFLLLLLVGFQGWLGKKVVDNNLLAAKITTHMLVALVIAAIPLLIIYRLKPAIKIEIKFLKIISVTVIVISLAQIVLGTQVREQIDVISKALQYQQRERWIERLDNLFIIHRSFSWVVAFGCLALLWKIKTVKALRKISFLVLVCVLATIGLGLIMAFAGMPAIAQPLHLLFASLLVMAVFSLRLSLK